MQYYSQQDICDIVAKVVAQTIKPQPIGGTTSLGKEVPVERSARHVHLTQTALDTLFGAGYQLKASRDLSQPGQFLASERVKLVTASGQLTNVAILGPVRQDIQVELSLTDAHLLGIGVPIRLSGQLDGAGDVLIMGPKGVVSAHGSAIAAKAHIHMTPEDAVDYGVSHGDVVSLRLNTQRPITLDDVTIRVDASYQLAAHIDYDEANAAQLTGASTATLLKKRCSYE